jgi:hypothetical protein
MEASKTLVLVSCWYIGASTGRLGALKIVGNEIDGNRLAVSLKLLEEQDGVRFCTDFEVCNVSINSGIRVFSDDSEGIREYSVYCEGISEYSGYCTGIGV